MKNLLTSLNLFKYDLSVVGLRLVAIIYIVILRFFTLQIVNVLGFNLLYTIIMLPFFAIISLIIANCFKGEETTFKQSMFVIFVSLFIGVTFSILDTTPFGLLIYTVEAIPLVIITPNLNNIGYFLNHLFKSNYCLIEGSYDLDTPKLGKNPIKEYNQVFMESNKDENINENSNNSGTSGNPYPSRTGYNQSPYSSSYYHPNLPGNYNYNAQGTSENNQVPAQDPNSSSNNYPVTLGNNQIPFGPSSYNPYTFGNIPVSNQGSNTSTSYYPSLYGYNQIPNNFHYTQQETIGNVNTTAPGVYNQPNLISNNNFIVDTTTGNNRLSQGQTPDQVKVTMDAEVMANRQVNAEKESKRFQGRKAAMKEARLREEKNVQNKIIEASRDIGSSHYIGEGTKLPKNVPHDPAGNRTRQKLENTPIGWHTCDWGSIQVIQYGKDKRIAGIVVNDPYLQGDKGYDRKNNPGVSYQPFAANLAQGVAALQQLGIGTMKPMHIGDKYHQFILQVTGKKVPIANRSTIDALNNINP